MCVVHMYVDGGVADVKHSKCVWFTCMYVDGGVTDVNTANVCGSHVCRW